MEALLIDYQNQLIDEYTGKSDDYVKEHADEYTAKSIAVAKICLPINERCRS